MLSALYNRYKQSQDGIPSQMTGESSRSTGRKEPIPKVAFYVMGAAVGVTAGLTILVIPFIRQAVRLNTPGPNFIAHRYSTRSLRSPSAPESSARIQFLPSGSQTSEFEELRKTRMFNDIEEERLLNSGRVTAPSIFVAKDGEVIGDVPPISPWMGIQALGIATALVMGTAGLSAYIVSVLLGVDDMQSFTAKMRLHLSTTLPSLVSSVNAPAKPDPPNPNFTIPSMPSDSWVSSDGERFDDVAIEQWVKWFEGWGGEEDRDRARPHR